MSESRHLLEFALYACELAGRITLQHFQALDHIEHKKDQSPVTIADKQSEEKIRAMIEKYFPNHSIVGEEFGSVQRDPDYIWYIDPIDGTRAYAGGVPIYGVMLGLEIKREFAVGVVHMPALRETVYAATGQGCYWNNRRASVSRTRKLSEALFCYAGREYFQMEDRLSVYEKLESSTRLQRTWGDCYAHILVATGRADVCVDPVLQSWDAAALIPILTEAGGVFTDWQGNVTPHNHEGISCNKELLPAILKITSPFVRLNV